MIKAEIKILNNLNNLIENYLIENIEDVKKCFKIMLEETSGFLNELIVKASEELEKNNHDIFISLMHLAVAEEVKRIEELV